MARLKTSRKTQGSHVGVASSARYLPIGMCALDTWKERTNSLGGDWHLKRMEEKTGSEEHSQRCASRHRSPVSVDKQKTSRRVGGERCGRELKAAVVGDGARSLRSGTFHFYFSRFSLSRLKGGGIRGGECYDEDVTQSRSPR